MRRASGKGSFTGDPGRYFKKDPGYGHLSIPVEAPLGNREGIRLPRLLTEKDSVSGFLSWTHRTLRFLVWGSSATLVKGQGCTELITDYVAQRTRL